MGKNAAEVGVTILSNATSAGSKNVSKSIEDSKKYVNTANTKNRQLENAYDKMMKGEEIFE